MVGRLDERIGSPTGELHAGEPSTEAKPPAAVLPASAQTLEPGRRPVDAYLNGLAPSSRPAMEDSLDVVAKFFGSPDRLTFDWGSVRYEMSQALRSDLMSRYKSRSVNRHLAALRGVLKVAWRLGLISTDDYHHARDVKVAKISEPPAGRRLSMDELRGLVTAGKSRRDAAFIAVLYAAGLRRFEVAGLNAGDYDRDTGQLTVRGKRNKVRQVKIHKDWRAPLHAWLDEYRPRPQDALFPSKKAGAEKGSHLSKSGVSHIAEAQRNLAGVAPYTTHDFRRSLITNLIASGADLVVVQRIAGHEQIGTTASYDRRGQAEEGAAIDRLEGLKKDPT